jgi:hypothetical protein
MSPQSTPTTRTQMQNTVIRGGVSTTPCFGMGGVSEAYITRRKD